MNIESLPLPIYNLASQTGIIQMYEDTLKYSPLDSKNQPNY